MRDPQALRDQAVLCRRMSEKRGKHLYLLELADRFDAEALHIERIMAGQKPGSAED